MSNPFRIVVVAPLGVGGVTTMMINIQKKLDRKKINFDYMTFHDRIEPCEEQVISLGSHKYVASADNVVFKPMRRIVRMVKITKLCRDQHIKVIHYNASSAADLTNIIAAKLGGVKHITIHSHNAGVGTTGRQIRAVSKISRPLLPFFCNDFWACSQWAAKFMFPGSVYKKNRYRVLKNGIDVDRFDYNIIIREKTRKELKVEDKFVIGHAGRFSPQKNHFFLIDIFKAVHDRDDSAVLLLYGTGELLGSVKEKVVALGLERYVRFMGVSERMSETWQAFDIFLMPSLYEGLPVSGIEAQASGVKCIFSDEITKEVDVSGKSVFLSLHDSAEKWAEMILKNKCYDRKSGADILRQNGYDIEQTARTMQEYYLSIHERMCVK